MKFNASESKAVIQLNTKKGSKVPALKTRFFHSSTIYPVGEKMISNRKSILAMASQKQACKNSCRVRLIKYRIMAFYYHRSINDCM